MGAALPAHPKILQLGKLDELFNGDIVAEEKIDGSQFAFGRAADDGRLVFRSKGRELFPENVDKLFANTVAAIQAREEQIRSVLLWGEFLYGEALHAPKHNTLAYERAPKGHLVLFGGTDVLGGWYPRHHLEFLAGELDLEITPLLGTWRNVDRTDRPALVNQLKAMIDGPSILGGKREGIVIKNYGQQIVFNGQAQPMFAKLVSDSFKEAHNENWKPGKDHLNDLLQGYRSEARWEKAVQRMREDGTLTETVRDIGPLVRAVQDDTWEEEATELGLKLAQHFKDQVRRIAVAGLPEWWKSQLLDQVAEDGGLRDAGKLVPA